MLIELLKPDFSFKDERGNLVQLVRKGYNQVNIIFSKKNVLRGFHFHKENKEAFYVISGSLKLSVSKDGVSECYTFKTGDMFLIPPFVNHSFVFLEDTLKVSLYDIGVEKKDGTKDIFVK